GGTATIHDNYFAAGGAYGALFPDSLNGWSVYNNVDMTNGNTINADNNESATVMAPAASGTTATAAAPPPITSPPETGGASGSTIISNLSGVLDSASAAVRNAQVGGTYAGPYQVGGNATSSSNTADPSNAPPTSTSSTTEAAANTGHSAGAG